MSGSGNGVMTTDPKDQHRSALQTHTEKEDFGEAGSSSILRVGLALLLFL